MQSYKNWELIIVDDGSTDNSVEIIQGYCSKYKNIRLFQHPDFENKGLGETLKLGISKAKGRYIAFLESDDYWDYKTLENRMDVFDSHSDVSLVFNSIDVFGDGYIKDHMKTHVDRCEKIYQKINEPTDISKYIFSVNLVPTFSCWMCTKEAINSCDFNTPIKYCLDLWLWTQIAFLNHSVAINKKLTHWRTHSDSYSGSQKASVEELKDFRKKLYARFQKIAPDRYTKFLNDSIEYAKTAALAPLPNSVKCDYIVKFQKANVCVFGAGEYAKKLLSHNKFDLLNVNSFIDDDQQKEGTFIGNYKIFHSSALSSLNPDYIILAMEEPDLILDELLNKIKVLNLNTKIVPNFFWTLDVYQGVSI